MGCSNHWASGGVPRLAVANNFAFVAVFLGYKGKAQERNGLKCGASGGAIVRRPCPFPEADVANEEGVRISHRTGVFSRSQEKEEGKSHHVRSCEGLCITSCSGDFVGAIQDGDGDGFDTGWWCVLILRRGPGVLLWAKQRGSGAPTMVCTCATNKRASTTVPDQTGLPLAASLPLRTR